MSIPRLDGRLIVLERDTGFISREGSMARQALAIKSRTREFSNSDVKWNWHSTVNMLTRRRNWAPVSIGDYCIPVSPGKFPMNL